MKIINYLFFFCTTTATEYALEIGPLDRWCLWHQFVAALKTKDFGSPLSRGSEKN
jgi:hypothetical protein